MTQSKLPAIPRAPRKATPDALNDFVLGGEEGEPRVAAKPVLIRAAVTPEFRRRLRLAALEHDTTVADILRAQAERWLAEQGG